ncbi:BCCT family transporter [Ihubacter massiliensis]|uniref:BCCT family transporter n=1 Tax=Hominibacterium faecale TaxID=2839743 RepID=A0A9J6QYS1_9FIRM|nr:MULTISPECIES: BCCT family transporter [Eubacteriales Family XIII. Incertae Sedis]MCC2864792.1 BCCT family transporter [Anaerovorax odorimutans]MCI7303669.1 BCCT family transporter [Clostridia bacterium]MDE8734699.1 BCCT family transporter [Eubacteriales bacterium DFI.9.88]MDY3013437.1 BCCT family transporter [Clostridiales Family XIII bacterium]MCO7120472.1 BCCT family transporter [Ihubacter massiliensis]
MEKPNNAIKQKAIIDKPISIVCIILVAIFVCFMCLKPDATLNAVNTVFNAVTAVMGVPILWFVFIGLFLCLYLALSKHGNVKLGEGEPEFSMFSYIAMMMCAALAATAVYYSFVEWSFYYADPAFGIEPYSQEAAEISLPYAFFHWGFSVQVIFVLTAVSLAYGYHVKKVPVLRISAVCERMMGNFKYKKPLGKLIDALTILSIVGGMGVSLGVGVPLISAGIGKIFGVEVTFTTNVIVLVLVAVVFSITSVVGIEKGMKKLSDWTMYAAIFLIAFIFITGPTQFIYKNFTYSVGKMFSNYVDMSLFTDPIRNSGFPELNTIFLFTLALNYAALMGIFITKISKGRTIREMILTCLGGISVGTWIMFGINGSFGMNAELTGQFALSKAEDVQAGLFDLLGTLPGGSMIIPIIFTLVTLGFLATSMDSASFTLAASATKKLDAKGNPNSKFRLVWCVVLALVPLSIMFAGAPFTAIKTVCIVLSVPFLFIIIGMLIGLFRWFKEDNN